jgi:inorganic triphosphatase YgiF
LPVLRRALGRLGNGRRLVRAKLISIYYETDDRALARKGLSLRVRERDGRFVQTVKSIGDGNGGALARGEWEDVIAGARPELNRPETGRFLKAGVIDRLKPVFRTEVRRDLVELLLLPARGSRRRSTAARSARPIRSDRWRSARSSSN